MMEILNITKSFDFSPLFTLEFFIILSRAYLLVYFAASAVDIYFWLPVLVGEDLFPYTYFSSLILLKQ